MEIQNGKLSRIHGFIKAVQLSLADLIKKGTREYDFEFNCNDLDDFNYIPIEKNINWKIFFDELKSMNGPVVYWFEIISDTKPEQIIESFKKYRHETPGAKSTPAYKNKFDSSSTTLYVGKVRSNVFGRIITHMGYYKVAATQGLQLFYWAKDMNLRLRVHIVEFKSEMADVLPIIEYAMAKELKPILGKHK